MERPRPLEIAKNAFEIAGNVGSFVVERLVYGMGWDDLPNLSANKPVKPPVHAHITYHTTGEAKS